MSDERLERVARAMCTADGRDPDQTVDGPPEGFINLQHRGSGVTTVFFGPQWETYHRQARAFLAGFDELNR
jgi:hypothetical protein